MRLAQQAVRFKLERSSPCDPKRQWALAAAIWLGASALVYGLASAQAPWVESQRDPNANKSLLRKWWDGEDTRRYLPPRQRDPDGRPRPLAEPQPDYVHRWKPFRGR